MNETNKTQRSWTDETTGVTFPPVLDGNNLAARRNCGENGHDYSLRYEADDPGDVKPRFEILVHGRAEPYVPDGYSEETVVELAKAVADVGAPDHAADVHFADEPFCAMLRRTAVPYLIMPGSYRASESGALFGTMVVVFPFRGRYFRIRYSESWGEKRSKSPDEVFDIIADRLLRPHKSMLQRVSDFLDALDGLFHDVLAALQPDPSAYFRLGVDPSVPDDEVFKAFGRKLDWLTPEEADVMGHAQEVVKAFAEICMARRLGGTLSEVLIPLGCRFLDRRDRRGDKPAVLPIPIRKNPK